MLKEQFAEKYSTLQLQQRRNKLVKRPQSVVSDKKPSSITEDKKKFTIKGLFKRKKSSSTLTREDSTQPVPSVKTVSVKSPSISSKSTRKHLPALPQYIKKRPVVDKKFININDGVVSYVNESRQLIEEVVPQLPKLEYVFNPLQTKLNEIRERLDALPIKEVKEQQEACLNQISQMLASIQVNDHKELQELKQQVLALQSSSFDYYQVLIDFGYFTLALLIRFVATLYWASIWLKRLIIK